MRKACHAKRTVLFGAVVLLAAGMASPVFSQSVKAFRIGVLAYGPGTSDDSQALISDIRTALTDLGYVEGRDVELVFKSGTAAQLAERAADLVRSDVSVIVAVRDPAALAATKATTTIPIVMTEFGSDPVKAGLASSFRRPGGNITGNTMQSDVLWENRLGKLRELVPRAKRLGVVLIRGNAGSESCFAAISEASKAVAMEAIRVEMSDLASAENILGRERLDALAMCGDAAAPRFAKEIADASLKLRLPTVAISREYAEAGVLLSSGANPSDQRREAVYYVDKIKKGAKPADLPIRQAGVFELVINVGTAKRIGVPVSPFFLQTVDAKVE